MGKLDDIKLQPHARAKVLRGLRVWNSTGSTIAAAALVYVSGWSETYKRFLVTLADADVVARGNAIFIIRNAITDGQGGVGWKTARVASLNTNSGSVSDPVYLSTTAGGWTLTAPSASGGSDQIVGRIAVKSATIGEVEFNLELSAAGSSGLGEFVSRLTVGATIAGTAEEVGAGSGNFLGVQMNFQNAGTTLTRLTGLQVDVDDTSTHSNTIACARFYSEKVSGVGTHEHWGIMAQSTVTAGAVANTSAGMFINIINGTSAVGTDGGSHRASAIVGEFDMASGADIATSPDALTGCIQAYHIGNNVNSAAKLKSTGIFIAVLGGDSATCATGAFFKCVRKNSIAASQADYGLDLYYDESGAYLANTFATADIRLGGTTALTISSGAGAPSASLPKGSLYLRSDGSSTSTRAYIATDASGSWASITTAS